MVAIVDREKMFEVIDSVLENSLYRVLPDARMAIRKFLKVTFTNDGVTIGISDKEFAKTLRLYNYGSSEQNITPMYFLPKLTSALQDFFEAEFNNYFSKNNANIRLDFKEIK